MIVLKTLGNAHQVHNEKARILHNRVFQEGLPIATADIPDVALVSNSETVGGAIIKLLQTIPGISTDAEMRDIVNNPFSIALSDRAISVLLRRKNGGEVGFSLTFAMPDWAKHKLEFERIDPQKQRIAVSIELGVDIVPIGGHINVGEKENGQFVYNKTTIEFDDKGNIDSSYPEYKLEPGDGFNIISLIQQITTPNHLGKVMNASKMIIQAKKEVPKRLASG